MWFRAQFGINSHANAEIQSSNPRHISSLCVTCDLYLADMLTMLSTPLCHLVGYRSALLVAKTEITNYKASIKTTFWEFKGHFLYTNHLFSVISGTLIMNFTWLMDHCSCKINHSSVFILKGVICATLPVLRFFRVAGKEMEQVCLCSFRPNQTLQEHRSADAGCAKPICPGRGICKVCLICCAAAVKWNPSGLQFGCQPRWGNLLWRDTNISLWSAHRTLQ